MKEFIAYQGDTLTVEWFFDENGISDSLDYFESLSDTKKRKTLMLFKRMGDFGKISDITKFRNEGDKVFAFKPQPDVFCHFFIQEKRLLLQMDFVKNHKNYQKRKKI